MKSENVFLIETMAVATLGTAAIPQGPAMRLHIVSRVRRSLLNCYSSVTTVVRDDIYVVNVANKTFCYAGMSIKMRKGK
jgi:hypothetical protein